MNERRALIALLLLAATAALYIWGRPDSADQKSKVPEKEEAEERAKANPFPD
jgi:hypothetical protein